MSEGFSKINKDWIVYILGAGLTVAGFFLTIQQDQLQDLRNGVNANQERIWEQQKVTVTQDNLDRFKSDISQMVDNKFQVISTRMDAMSAQVSTMANTVNQQAQLSNKQSETTREILQYLKDDKH